MYLLTFVFLVIQDLRYGTYSKAQNPVLSQREETTPIYAEQATVHHATGYYVLVRALFLSLRHGSLKISSRYLYVRDN